MAWQKSVANFQNDLKAGQKSEAALVQAFGGSVLALDGRKGDMFIAETGLTIELKTDRYDHTKTENFFCETISYGDKPGGAYQAEAAGIEYFVYCFINPDPIFFIFKTSDFARRLRQIEKSKICRSISIPNRGYITQGLKVHRALFEDLEIKSWEDLDVRFNAELYSAAMGNSQRENVPEVQNIQTALGI